MKATKYNKTQAERGAWTNGLPEPFCFLAPDSVLLVDMVKEFQQNNSLDIDGKIGPGTYAAMMTVLGAPSNMEGIYIGGSFIKMPGFPTITYKEDHSLVLPRSVRKALPNAIVLHYDVTFNARATKRVLLKRGYSTHFCIDHDGTIFQFADPKTHKTYHAGSINKRSIGIDINNPADIKYQVRDANLRKAASPLGTARVCREIEKQKVHGHTIERLSYFPCQIKALNALLDVLCEHFEIPKEYPTQDGTPVYGVYKGWKTFEGVLGHYHIERKKTDPSPLSWTEDIWN